MGHWWTGVTKDLLEHLLCQYWGEREELVGENWSRMIALSLYFQFVILVIDSTDRERLSVSKEELYRMLNCEVHLPCLIMPSSEPCGWSFHGLPFILDICRISGNRLCWSLPTNRIWRVLWRQLKSPSSSIWRPSRTIRGTFRLAAPSLGKGGSCSASSPSHVLSVTL